MINNNVATVEYWLNVDNYKSNDSAIFTIDLIRLASVRKSISNFIKILTRRNIPVQFNKTYNNFNLDNKEIYISANIKTKNDYDVVVGLALHEAAHSLKTDFDVLKVAFLNIPHKLLVLSDSKNITRASIEKFIHTVWNVIEDRYIDNYIYNKAPGYRGYYSSLYNRYINCEEVDKLLLNPNLFRFSSLDSYEFRIINFTNDNTDLYALPNLYDIAKLIDISNIDRLTTTKDRIMVAFDVVELVLNSLDIQSQRFNSINGNNSIKSSDKLINGSLNGNNNNNNNNNNDNSNENDDKNDLNNNQFSDVSSKSIKEISNIINGTPTSIIHTNDIVHKISDIDVGDSIMEDIKNVNENQKSYIFSNVPKASIDDDKVELLDLIDKNEIIIKYVDVSNITNIKNLKIDCVVVKKMTKELLFSGRELFPLCRSERIGNNLPPAEENVAEAVLRGIAMGIKLGRKLQIRNEANPLNIIYKKFGKLNKRHLHKISFDREDIFYNTKLKQYSDVTLHITVDASSSMSGEKWIKTMTTVVAIAKAASMTKNIHVSISFRTTLFSNNICLPYIVLAYNSKHDPFSKIKTLFPYLIPFGNTPEGLCFDSIINLFNEVVNQDNNKYLLNLSDGQPCYEINIPNKNIRMSYSGESACKHTKQQVEIIKSTGVDILSYYIDNIDNSNLKMFKKMYGEHACNINVDNIIDIAKTMNKLFLKTDE